MSVVNMTNLFSMFVDVSFLGRKFLFSVRKFAASGHCLNVKELLFAKEYCLFLGKHNFLRNFVEILCKIFVSMLIFACP